MPWTWNQVGSRKQCGEGSVGHFGINTHTCLTPKPPQITIKWPPHSRALRGHSNPLTPLELLFCHFQFSKKIWKTVRVSQRATNQAGNKNKWTDMTLHPTTSKHILLSFNQIDLWYKVENSQQACCHLCNPHSWRRLPSPVYPSCTAAASSYCSSMRTCHTYASEPRPHFPLLARLCLCSAQLWQKGKSLFYSTPI